MNIQFNFIKINYINRYIPFIIIYFFCVLHLHSQSTPNIKELSLVFQNVNQFGLTYKTGNENALWNIGGLSALGKYSSNHRSQYDETDHILAISLMLGREFRKNLAPRLNMVYGIDLIFTYFILTDDSKYKPPFVNQDEEIKWLKYSLGLAFNFGANYEINQRFLIGIVMNIPSITLSFETVEGKIGNSDIYKTDDKTINYGLSNYNSSLILSFRF